MPIQKILLVTMLIAAGWYICKNLAPDLMQAAEKCELE